MKIRRVTVKARRDYDHLTRNGSIYEDLEAELEDGDDYDECVADLQAKVEAAVQRHYEHIRAAVEMERAAAIKAAPAPEPDPQTRTISGRSAQQIMAQQQDIMQHITSRELEKAMKALSVDTRQVLEQQFAAQQAQAFGHQQRIAAELGQPLPGAIGSPENKAAQAEKNQRSRDMVDALSMQIQGAFIPKGDPLNLLSGKECKEPEHNQPPGSIVDADFGVEPPKTTGWKTGPAPRMKPKEVLNLFQLAANMARAAFKPKP
jgi:hypothetical protein